LGSEGQVSSVIGYGLDVSQRRQAERALQESEEQFRQAQKMEAVGRLAAGVAHDFNNLLTVISGHSNLLLLDLEKNDPRRSSVEDIAAAGDSAAGLTQQLLAFSRRQVLQPKVVDPNTVVSQVSKMLRRLLGEDVDVVIVPRPDTGHVKADPGQMEQVIINMAVNARDAMPEGGRLTVSTGNVTLDERFTRQHTGLDPGEYVALTMKDTGVGMSEQTLVHVFEPFFTTKGSGKGTGLGLSTVYGIVKQSGGYITADSEVGTGTTFTIYLPRVDAAGETVKQADAMSAKRHAGSETILLVEDAEGVRAVARRILSEAGYTVLEADGGQAAIEQSTEHRGAIHLLLTDVVMPHMNGKEVAQHLGRSNPELKVLFMSGYTDDAIVHRGVLEPNIELLEKPFTVSGLLAKVREVLDRAA
jgi:nitrogen-specific signal transduction histidine kinase/ActR/RegA family two-component response regulator